MSRRFDYVAFSEDTTKVLMSAQELCHSLESLVDSLGGGRSQALALTKLEECYMWIGKALRDREINANPEVKNIPERTNT